jgi:ABC-type Na+ efflux pump permease subunit
MSSFIRKNKKPSVQDVVESISKKSEAVTANEKGKTKSSKKNGTSTEEVAESIPEQNDLISTPEDLITKELIDKHVNELIVKDALRALIKYENTSQQEKVQSKKKQSLFDENNIKSILLQVRVTFFKLFFSCSYLLFDFLFCLFLFLVPLSLLRLFWFDLLRFRLLSSITCL